MQVCLGCKPWGSWKHPSISAYSLGAVYTKPASKLTIFLFLHAQFGAELTEASEANGEDPFTQEGNRKAPSSLFHPRRPGP